MNGENTYNSFLHRHRSISVNTKSHTSTKHAANTQPKILRPALSNATPSASVAVTYTTILISATPFVLPFFTPPPLPT